MISVQSVYETVKNLVNKDQKGFVSPEVFNSFAKVAQLNIFNEMFEDIYNGNKLRRMNVDGGGHLSAVTKSRSDLSPFRRTVTLEKNVDIEAFEKPLDFSTVVNCTLTGRRGRPKTNVQLVHEEEKINHILSSNLSAPSRSFPVALISEDIEVFPTSITRIEFTYLRSPVTPSYQATFAEFNGVSVEVFNPDTSQDFELPVHCEQELVAEIATMMGINIRDKDVYTHGSNEEIKA
tara:strand:+ start:2277 stop:2981 length:705 start_codon:yes stop_codon:yes gene_type:complete